MLSDVPGVFAIFQSEPYSQPLGLKADDPTGKTGFDDCPQVELLIVPNREDLQPMLQAFKDCNMMNPDSDDSGDEDDELYTKGEIGDVPEDEI